MDHEGEGFSVEVLNETTALVYWFTYDSQGKPTWLVAVAAIDGAQIFAEEVLITSGAKLGPTFDPDDVVKTKWGQAIWTFGSCSNGGMRYVGPPNFGPESTQNLSRLTGYQNVPCAFNTSTYSVSGPMTVAENVYIDGDTNDPDTALIPNNGEDGYQDIFTPATVAGFASAEPTGEPDSRFEFDADEIDVFRIALRKDEQVSLFIAEHNSSNPGEVDLDLWLYDVNDTENPVDESLTLEPSEVVTAPFDGEYWVLVAAFKGKSNYLLRTGFEPGLQSYELSVTAEAVSDELIVHYQSEQDLADSVQSSAYDHAVEMVESKLGLMRLASSPDGSTLYRLPDSYVDMYSRYEFPLEKYGFHIEDHRKWIVVVTAKALLGNSTIRGAGPNYIGEVQAKPNDEGYFLQWHYRTINLEGAWDITTGTKDVVVAAGVSKNVLDS